MKLRVEVTQSSTPGRWGWRVRSDDTRTGEACLAVGTSRISAEDASRLGVAVADALKPIFCGGEK